MAACDPVFVGGSLADWITHVFDHPVAEPAWYWATDAPIWEDDSGRIATLVAETFEDGGRLLARFTDAQLNQGCWFLVSAACSGYLYALVDLAVPLPVRLRALRAFVPLFEQVMARRCSPHLSHLDEPGANPLNGICYMWWDVLSIVGQPEKPERAEFDAEVLKVLRTLLTIPHDACRESALHGIGEWRWPYPSAAEIIDDFLRDAPDIRPELAAYAQQAKAGRIQ